jgi:ribonuclease HI
MPKAKVQISATKDNAKNLHESLCRMSDTEAIYTDGSGINGKIGAAAYCERNSKVALQHLGNETQYNVFAAELTALCLSAIEVQEDSECHRWNIYVDSQAAIQAVDRPRRQSGQSIIKEFIDTIDTAVMENPDLKIAITWVPGHSEVEGNEIVDAEAKKAAIGTTAAKPFHHKPLRSSRAQSIKAAAKTQWTKDWNNNTKTSQALRRILRRPGAERGTKLYSGLQNRSAVAALTRLQTGHCGLNHYLHRFKLSDTPYCTCGHGKETVEHYLLECSLYWEQSMFSVGSSPVYPPRPTRPTRRRS